jgi:hypothetical protein
VDSLEVAADDELLERVGEGRTDRVKITGRSDLAVPATRLGPSGKRRPEEEAQTLSRVGMRFCYAPGPRTVSLGSNINASAPRAQARLRRLFRRRERCPACGRRIRSRDHVVRDLSARGVSRTYHQLCALNLHVPSEEGPHNAAGRKRTFGQWLTRRRRERRQT